MRIHNNSSPHGSDPELTSSAALDDILDQLADRLASGESVRIEPYLQQCPAHSELLKSAFDSLQQLFRARQDSLASPPPETLPEALQSTRYSLGDFQLLRELGRGGMGIVYEARQLSLDRRVAVKVLPYAALLEPRQLDRFQLEARAAARLHHPNIVSVHAVGCDRGLHYYAMDYIQGAALSEVIEQLRNGKCHNDVLHRLSPDSVSSQSSDLPANDQRQSQSSAETHPLAELATLRTARPSQFARSVASLGASIAEALHYAHEQGVTHRDIKPSNLILDYRGTPWITDFGLAQINGDPGLTASGARLGTLRYMSPEQSRGRKLLDHRTDVYSLGATLFELLTFRCAVDGIDGEQILKELSESSVPRVRQFAPHIPVDLDTIIAKSMAKLPEDRYDSAQDLAIDLRRFLQNKPIMAMEPSRIRHLMRWIDNHRFTTALSMVTILLTVMLAVMGPIFAIRYRRLIQEERTARLAASTSREQLRGLLRDSLTTTATALADVPNIDSMRVSLIRDTLQQYAQMLQATPDDVDLEFDVAKAQIRLGNVIQFWHDATDETVDYYRQAKSHLEHLTTRYPDSPDYLYELSEAEYSLALANEDLPGLQRAANRSLDLVERFPHSTKYRTALGYGQKLIADELIRRGKIQSAETTASDAVRTMRSSYDRNSSDPDARAHLAVALATLAEAHLSANQLAAATVALHEAIDLPNELSQVKAGKMPINVIRAQIQRYYAVILASRGDLMESQRQLNASIRDMEEIVTSYPLQEWARGELIRDYLALAEISETIDDNVALEVLSHAIQLAEQCSPGDVGNQILYARCLYRRGTILWLLDRSDSACEDFRSAIRLAEQHKHRSADIILAEMYSMIPDLALRNARRGVEHAKLAMQEQDGDSLRLLGVAYYRAGELRHAVRLLQHAQEQRHGGDAREAYFLALAYRQLGDEVRATSCLAQATELVQQPNLVCRWDIALLRRELNGQFSSIPSEK